MLFLDTNAFYYAAGISTTSINLPELMKLILENETCISVVSLHEFLVKFRNDVGIIKTGLLDLKSRSTARVKLATAIPLPVRRSSGSRTKRPMMVI